MRRARFELRIALLALSGAIAGCSRDDAPRTDPPSPYAAEVAEREAFAKKTLEAYVDEARPDGGARIDPARISSSSEIQFDEGFSILSYEPADIFPPSMNAFRWMGQRAHIRLKRHGDKAMKIVLAGWAHQKMLKTRPVMDFFVDGFYVGSSKPIEREHYWIDDIVVPSWALRRPWVDLEIRTNAVAFHWGDPPTLRVLLAYRFEWKELE